MENDEFSWNDDKAARNLARHGVDFARAMRALRDPFAVEVVDDREDQGDAQS